MTNRLLVPLALLAALTPLAPAAATDAKHPVVVELYQSQGCSSCPPAIANINSIAGRDDVLALTFAVSYWDQLGWKDTFAAPEFTDRQYTYSRAGLGRVATPQTIINGRLSTNGGNRAALIDTIRKANRGASGPALTVKGNQLAVGAGKADKPATLWLVRYDPRTLSVPIKAGENGGRTLAHRNVVRSIVKVGSWTGAATNVTIPAATNPAWRSAVLVQKGTGGPILAAIRL